MVTRFNSPHIPPSLLLQEILRRRMISPTTITEQYKRRFKGFMGERKLSNFFNELDSDKALPLYSLLLTANDTEFQVDSLLLTSKAIFLLEVKNYTGNYYMKDNKIYFLQTNKEINSPFLQLDRSTFLLKSLLEELGIAINIRSYIVFVNNSFTLYEAPINIPVIFPTQIERFVQRINANSASLTKDIKSLAHLLTTHHQEQSIYEQLPSYRLDDLNKGVFCTACQSRLYRKNKTYFVCPACRYMSHIKEVILRATAEFHFLFPEMRITTKQINDWCGGAFSNNTIRHVLYAHLKQIPNGRYTHYLFPHKDDCFNLLVELYDSE